MENNWYLAIGRKKIIDENNNKDIVDFLRISFIQNIEDS